MRSEIQKSLIFTEIEPLLIRYPAVDAKAFRKKVEALITARNEARKAKNFTEADRIRAELRVMRVEVKDNKDGSTTWELAR